MLKNLEQQLHDIFTTKQSTQKIAYVLSQLDFSYLDNNESKFSLNSIAKLYIFRFVKGFRNYERLLEYFSKNPEEGYMLGFYNDLNNNIDLPSKRTYNYYFQTLISKQQKEELGLIAEKILSIATQHKILLDLEIVQRTIKEYKEKDDKKIREAISLVKKLVYPLVDLKIKENGKFTTKDLLNVLVHVAYTHDFANNGAETFRISNDLKESPSGDLMLHHFSKFDSIYKIREMFDKITDLIFNFAKSNYNILRDRKHEIAYDIHKILYYGKGILYACSSEPKDGTSNFIEFLTCSIVTEGRRFIVDVVPIHPFDDVYKLLDRSLSKIKNRLKIEKAYLDRGFNEVNIYKVFDKHKIQFLMPMIRFSTVKAAFDKAQFGPSRVFKDFKIGDYTVNLILVDDEVGVKRAFICNFDVSPIMAHRVYDWYSARWGIETSYRQLDHDFLAKTTTRNYHIRLFYFLFSTCLFNIWVLVNICISLSLYGRVGKKPLITSKLFALILCKVRDNFDNGG